MYRPLASSYPPPPVSPQNHLLGTNIAPGDGDINSLHRRRKSFFITKVFVFLSIIILYMIYFVPIHKFTRTISAGFETYVTGHRSQHHGDHYMKYSSKNSETGIRRPIMYTFYWPKEDGAVESAGDLELLDLWKERWYEAGWDARILSLNDAKKHPRFKEFEKKLKVVPFRGRNVVYNQLCFYRWLAMAAVGGGWMSDMDVLPLNVYLPPDEYLDDGKFAIYSSAYVGGIPCLMSGSQDAWERLAFAILENGVEHKDEQFWSDMFASIDLYEQDPESYKLLDLMGEVTNVEWNDISCNDYSEKLAVHFSHSALHKLDLHDINLRPQFAIGWMKEWKAKCGGGRDVGDVGKFEVKH